MKSDHNINYSPLTSPQREIWFDQMLYPKVPLYNIGGYMQIEGNIDHEIFESGVNLLVQQCDCLQTILIEQDEEAPMQTFHKELQVNVLFLDFSAEANAHKLALEWMEQNFRLPFELYGKPLFYYALLKTDESYYFWFKKYHHIIIDGWGTSLLTQSLAKIYSQLAQDKNIDFSAPSYVGFVKNDRAYVESNRFEKHRQYWLDKYQTIPDAHFSPRYLDRFDCKTPPSECQILSLDRPTYNRLIDLAQNCKVSTFHVILGILYVYFIRTGQNKDFVVGLPVLNRSDATFKNTAGLFVGVSAARFNFGTELSFKELLESIGKELKQNYRNQRFPISELNRYVGLQKTGRRQLFDISLSYEKHSYDASFDSSPIQAKTLLHGYEQTPLMIYVREFHDDEDVDIDFVYNLAYFNAKEIEQIQDRFMLILEYVLNHVDKPIRTIPLLTKSEQQQLQVLNQAKSDYPKDKTIIDLFHEQAEKTPNNIAVVFEGQQLAYSELNQKANQLAHYLLSLKNKTNNCSLITDNLLIGICVERSLDMIIALLGVLKAGCAYLPLDPDYPEQRLKFMLEDSSVPVLLSQSHLLERLPVATLTVVCLNSEWERIAAGSEKNTSKQIEPKNLAYVLYTSGSTGAPKGVMVEHQSVLEILYGFEQIAPGNDSLRGISVCSYSFDASVWEFFINLCFGRTLHLVDLELLIHPTSFVDYLFNQQINCAYIPPALLVQVVDELEKRTSEVTLQRLLIGVEPIKQGLMQRYHNLSPKLTIINGYGPTETTICSTFYSFIQADKSDHQIPIGKPVQGDQIYVMDSSLQLSPPGNHGELCISGAGLARGYLNRPELTAEKFIEIELFDKLQRIYKTGDIAHWLPDGNLEYLGRLDNQVKLRGFRIELSEIEATLSQHKAVKEAVVALYEGGESPCLAAYITVNSYQSLVINKESLRKDEDFSNSQLITELHVWLKTRLPQYMLPASITVLNKLPLTLNGKIDRKALPEPKQSMSQDSLIKPRNELEQKIVEIWQEVLDLSNIGVNQDFFALGGDSLKAVKIVNRLQTFINEPVHLVTIFKDPTPARLASYFEKAYHKSAAKLLRKSILHNEVNSNIRLTDIETDNFKKYIPNPKPFKHVPGNKNMPAIFVLSPPRSGSTLLRVMLAGHPGLFAPPELWLMDYNTLKERESALIDERKIWREGAVIALMQSGKRNLTSAEKLIAELINKDVTIQQFYSFLQESLEGQILVDKTPVYSMSLETLKRMELCFHDALYIHLIRHPSAVIRSFEEARFDQLLRAYMPELPQDRFNAAKLGELTWLTCHQNITQFLSELPSNRQCSIEFEELVKEPYKTMTSVCEFLGLSFDQGMIDPYCEKQQRMTAGLNSETLPVGDIKFYQYKSINPKRAEHWKTEDQIDLLSELTVKKAESLGCKITHLPSLQTGPIPVTESQLEISFAQQRLWFLVNFEGESSTYNMPACWCLEGELNLEAMQKTVMALVVRHTSLRLAFTEKNGQPSVKILESYNPLSVKDLTSLNEKERQLHIAKHVESNAKHLFDLANGPLFYVKLLKLNKTKNLLLLNMHHIISDGWSIGVLLRDLSASYTAYCNNQTPELPTLSIQYTDYAVWQRSWLQGKTLSDQLTYWQNKLARTPKLLNLPTDYVRPAVIQYHGAHFQSDLPMETVNELKQLCQEQEASLYMALLGLFNILLYRYSGNDDILVGSPVAHRTHSQTENVIGFFANTLVMRVKVKGEQSFEELLKQVKETTLEAYSHQDVPFELIVEHLNPVRSLIHTPLFQTMFVLQDKPPEELELNELQVSFIKRESGVSKFDLTLNMAEKNGSLVCNWEYRTDLFKPETIERMAAHFQTLLQNVVNNPAKPVSQLSLLTEKERQTLFVWSQAKINFPTEKTIAELFTEQATKTPENIAVVFEDKSLTYRELDQKSNQLANYLLSLKNKSDNCPLITDNCLIAICIERSLDMVISLLAILKAGCAYMPLATDYPKERLRFMLEESQTVAILTQTRFIEQLTGVQSQVIDLEKEVSNITRCSLNNPSSKTKPEDLAYVIYTSGSTGIPKGVCITQQAVVNLIYDASYADLNQDQVFLQYAPVSFDAATFEIWGALLNGAKLGIMHPHKHSLSELAETISEQSTTILWLTAGLFNLMVDQHPEGLCGIKQLLIGGEKLSPTHVKLALAKLPNTQIINGYGPTENTTFTCSFPIVPKDYPSSIPIGKPIGNSSVYILDNHNQPSPIGIAGELCTAGPGIAKGYLKRPELTSEKFIELELFGKRRRIYKTGDMARWLSDGDIEYLGRLDHQIKLRGFRIELGEIESALCKHRQVSEAVALLVDKDNNPQIVAYVTFAKLIDDAETVLKTCAKTILPGYMIPSSFIILETMPLTPNGKINRNELMSLHTMNLDTSNHDSTNNSTSPSTPDEELLAAIWEEVLKVNLIGIHDNFFDIGGHSLMAVNVISRIKEAFNIDMPVSAIFESPTIAALSQSLNKSRNDNNEISQLPIEPVINNNELPLSYAQERLWFLDHLEETSATYNIAGGLRIKGELNSKAMEKSLNEIMRRHESLRALFKTVDGSPKQEILSELRIDLTPEEASEHDIKHYSSMAIKQPFGLSTGPLFKLKLFKIESKEFILFIIMHHIISDGWSIGVFLNELKELYTAFSKGKDSPLPEPAIQYTDYAYWQRDWLNSTKLNKQLNYWVEQLKGSINILELPSYKPRPTIPTYNGASESVNIDQELTYKIKALCREKGTTMFMTLFSAFAILLYRYTGQDDITIGAPVANRNHKDTEELIGFFVNTLPLRADLTGHPEFIGLLNRVRSMALNAYDNQDIPFERLVEELAPDRNTGNTPLFQTMFSIESTPDKELGFPGLEVSLWEVKSAFSRFDLTMLIKESEHGLSGFVEYNTDLFRGSFIRNMISHFKTILASATNNPYQKIGELPMLSKPEQNKIIYEWNQTESEHQYSKCVHQLFEEHTRQNPQATAIVFQDKKLTYEELDNHANNLACHLQQKGVGSGTLVGVCIERSFEMIIGIMGILKAGAAYAPLDPSYPEERLAYMVDDSNMKAILIQKSVPKVISNLQLKIHLIDLVEIEKNIKSAGVKPNFSPENLAYVIYTSGSTGKPNGVEIAHKGLCNLAYELTGLFNIQPESRVLQFASLNFDASVFEIMMALCSGAQLYLAGADESTPGAELVEFINRSEISHVILTPSVLATMSVNDLPKLEVVIAGAEQCPADLANKWSKKAKFFNAYGPTEATICVAINQCDGTVTPPIGRPISNCKLYILDKNMQPLPVGVPGELYIGGISLARGYHNNPELTTERFITNPFSAKPDSRIYKTGDLVKYLPDGNIEYLGRIDHQIKVRGFRIEPGEIESTLIKYPGVKNCAIIAWTKEPHNKQLIAYLVSDSELDITELKRFAKSKLPGYMVPAYFLTMERFPVTPNGKIDRHALPLPNETQGESPFSTLPHNNVEQAIFNIWHSDLKLDNFGLDDNFFDIGGHSLLLIKAQSKLKDIFNKDVPIHDLFQYPTIRTLARSITGTDNHDAIHRVEKNETQHSNGDIAIISMACRFPGATNIEEFWVNLQAGTESIDFFTNDELIAEGVGAELLNNPNYVKAKGVLKDIEKFDAAFFGVSPREAEIMDPQHRIFLEISWELIERAGYNPETYEGLIGVYAGVGINSYLISNLLTDKELFKRPGALQILIGNDKDFVPTRVSYKLNLKGPSINVNTACSTSLTAVQLACQGLINGQCNMAIAGGVTIHVPQKRGYLYQESGVMSPDGHCRAFDANAKGTVGGCGAGVVLLKRLEDARKDGDTIYAVIKGAAINNDGSAKVGYTAPGVNGQIDVINRAIEMARINPETISYLETHGTGTTLGDPIEVMAMTKAFRQKTSKTGFCAIGSVKTNIGHLDTAAGAASLIKTALSLKHHKIPPSLHFKKSNPEIDFKNSPFYVNQTLSDWETDGEPRRAGVSSFGIGGTNIHLILEEAPFIKNSDKAKPWQLISLSANSELALERMTENLVIHLKNQPDLNLADVAYTLHIGRKPFPLKQFVVCRNRDDVLQTLETDKSKRIQTHKTRPGNRSVTFMFPGLGEQYINMTIGLYKSEPTFRNHIDLCSNMIAPLLGDDIKDIIFQENREDTNSSLPQPRIDLRKMLNPEQEDEDKASQKLNQTKFAHPANFIIEYAMAQLLINRGVKPDAMIGYSLGEYVAACIAGTITLNDVLCLLVKRAELIEKLPKGAMLAVPLPPEELEPMLEDELSIALINSDSLCVAAGPDKAIMKLEQTLREKNFVYKRIRASHAFHSKMMEPIKEEFIDFLESIDLYPPKIPYISNVTGTWIKDEEATSPSYWAEHTCRTVNFSKGVGLLLENPETVLIEVGPGQSLTGFAIQHQNFRESSNGVALPSIRNRNENISDEHFFLNALGRLWMEGVAIDFSSLYTGEQRQRIPLPTYPFEKNRYWIEPKKLVETKPDVNVISEDGVLPRLDSKEWFYTPTWKRTTKSHAPQSGIQNWMIFADDANIGLGLANWLAEKDQNIIVVKKGDLFSTNNDGSYTIRPSHQEDYCHLILLLKKSGRLPNNIVHLWSTHVFQQRERVEDKLTTIHEALDTGFYSLIFLAQAIGEARIDSQLKLGIITNNMQSVTSDEIRCPEAAVILGPCKVIPQEYKNITCGSIDLDLTGHNKTVENQTYEHISTEFQLGFPDQVIAYRGYRRWTQTFEKIHLNEKFDKDEIIRKGGVYLITGGLGGIGLGIAKYLVEESQSTPVLLGRTGLPPKEEWTDFLATHDEQDITCTQIRKVLDMEALGFEIMIVKADVSDKPAMQYAINLVLDRFKKINGVFHTAGLPGTGLIQVKTKEIADEVIAPKIEGTLVLEELLMDMPLDFMVLFSSNTSILSEVGQVDYCAANAFLDSYAHYSSFHLKRKTIVINWDAWKWDNWQKTLMNKLPELYKQTKQFRKTYGLTLEEGAKAMVHSLSLTEPQIIVSTRDFIKLEEHHKSKKDDIQLIEKITQINLPGPAHERPNIGTRYEPPENETEKQIVEMWQELLGIDKVGIYDNFFQLGGHSLLGIQLLSRLRETFEVKIPLKALFNAPTVIDLTRLIEEMILLDIEGLSDDEINEQVMDMQQNQESDPGDHVPQKYQLPNMMTILHLNKAETDHFYKDIFEDHVYYKNGIKLNKGDIVFDVGANIGLFAIFVNEMFEDVTVYSFEPAPPLFDILKNNTSRYDKRSRLFNCGLSNQSGESKFVFYPKTAGMSSFYADKKEEMDVLTTIMTNQKLQGMECMDMALEHADDLLEERFKEKEYVCQLRKLSSIIDEHNIDKINLLKIDVQKSEMDVIKGIDENHWDKIDQIVIEAHDIDGRIELISDLFKYKGYTVRTEQDELYKGSNIFNIYATNE